MQKIMTKYNNKKIQAFNRTWDSKMEYHYYLYLLELKEQGEILDIELQPVFILQESFTYKNKKIRPITYKADFKVKYEDGHIEIIDVKGFCTSDFKIKFKMAKYKYPELDFRCVKKKGKEWIEV